MRPRRRRIDGLACVPSPNRERADAALQRGVLELEGIPLGEPWRSVVDYLVHQHPEFPGCLVGEYPEGGVYVYSPITYIPPTGAITPDWPGWMKLQRCRA